MLRIIHAFDVKPGVVESSFIEWLDSQLDQVTRRFGCLERKTWLFVDGIRGDYEHGKAERRPKYLNEAFWPDQQCVENFRNWLRSPAARDFRNKWFAGVRNHTVLRYLDYEPRRHLGDD